MNWRSLLKQPSAFAPVAISLVALAVVLVHVAVFGAAREADEGAAARLWQLLMGAQVFVVGWFALKWLPRAPKPALSVLGFQAVAGLAALAPVWFLHL